MYTYITHGRHYSLIFKQCARCPKNNAKRPSANLNFINTLNIRENGLQDVLCLSLILNTKPVFMFIVAFRESANNLMGTVFKKNCLWRSLTEET